MPSDYRETLSNQKDMLNDHKDKQNKTKEVLNDHKRIVNNLIISKRAQRYGNQLLRNVKLK